MLQESRNTKKTNRRVLYEITKHVSIRKSHPFMYRVLMIVAIVGIASAINLYLSKPTFAPYGLPKEIIATAFLVLGAGLTIFLNLYHNLKLVRVMTGIFAAFLMFWGLSNTQQAFAGKASFAFPIFLVGFAFILLASLLESASNPLTDKNEEKK